jgi:hypothetical protein
MRSKGHGRDKQRNRKVDEHDMLRVLGEQHRLQVKRIQRRPQQRYCHIDNLR